MLLLTVCFTINCYSGPGGDLHPQVGEGYTVGEKNGLRAAQIVFGETTVWVDGGWNEYQISNGYTIENNSAVPFTLDFEQVKVEVQREESAGTTIIKITDLSNYDTKAFDDVKNVKKIYEYSDSSGNNSNYNGKPGYFGTKKVSCPPKKKCIFSIIASSGANLNRDKSIEITLPAMSSVTKETVVFFNLRRNSVWDSLTARIN
jgi:hypothetical protein